MSNPSSARAKNLFDQVRQSPPDKAAKILHDTAHDLAKYEIIDSNGTHVKRPGLLGKSMAVKKYRDNMLSLLRTLANLQPPFAENIGKRMVADFPDAPTIANKLKQFNKELESKTARPSTSETEAVFMYDSEAKFQKLTALFSGSGVKEAFSNESYQKQCSEIERLLRGEHTALEQRDQALMEDSEQCANLARLSEMLHTIGGKDGKLASDPNSASGSRQNSIPGGYVTQIPPPSQMMMHN